MKTFVPRTFLFLLILLIFFSWLADTEQPKYSARLAMQSDAMAIVDYYLPSLISLQDVPLEEDLVLPSFQSAQPKYGAFVIGNSRDSVITVALDEQEAVSLIYIDKNNNEDLTDDGEPNWSEEKAEYWAKEVLVDVYYNREVGAPVPYPVQFYRYKSRLKESLVAFRNGYREGEVLLEDTPLKIALLDDDSDGLFNDLDRGAMILDLNHDGILDGASDSPEHFRLSDPFHVNGRTYQVFEVTPSGDFITIVPGDTVVGPKITLKVGDAAPAFRAQTMNGEIVDLALYKNKVTLIDFWATWCKPWEKELASMKRSYRRHRDRGFEIIGVCLDSDLKSLQSYLDSNGIVWPQICDGRGWDTKLVEAFGVEAVPKNFLLDRRGIIRYKDVHGSNLNSRVYEVLNEPVEDTN